MSVRTRGVAWDLHDGEQEETSALTNPRVLAFNLVVHPTNRKWVITPVGSGFTLLIPVISGVITHLLSGMNHQPPSNSIPLGQHIRFENNVGGKMLDLTRDFSAWICIAMYISMHTFRESKRILYVHIYIYTHI